MSKATPAKLLILVALIVIICIPEFFPWHRVSRVNFLCVPCGPAGECGRPRKRQVEESRREEGKRREDGLCDPCRALGSDPPQTEPLCGAGYRGNGTDPARPDHDEGGKDGTALLMCETDMEEAYFRGGSFLSDSPDVWLEVQLEETVHLNLVLYEQRNASSLSLHPSTEPDNDDKRQKAFYCCLPPPPMSRPTNHSRCLIRLANRTALSAAIDEPLPWERSGKRDEWQAVFKALWLALIGVLLLLVLWSLLDMVHQRRGKIKRRGLQCDTHRGARLNGSGPLTDPSSGIVLGSMRLPHWTADACNVVHDSRLHGDMDGHDPPESCTAHPHHQGRPSLASISEEKAL